MEFVVNAAIYTDIAHMRVGHVEGTAGEKPEIYYPKKEQDQNDSLMVKDETFSELGKQSVSPCFLDFKMLLSQSLVMMRSQFVPVRKEKEMHFQRLSRETSSHQQI